MTPFSDLRRLSVRVLAPVALTAALLVACGGGTSQVQAFKPTRVIALGDENSVIVNDGSNDGFRYTINDRRGTAAGKCALLPIFVQALGSYYGYSYEQCNPNAATPKAFIRAIAGAKVDDPTSGLVQQLAAAGTLGTGDLVSLMIGANDVIELYERVQAGTLNAADAIAEAERRGTHTAEHVNAILATGARAIIITMPDMGLSPYAANANKTNPGASALLSRMSTDFNGFLRTRINATAYDGRNYGLVLADDIVAAMAKSPTSFLSAPANAVDAACTSASVLDCVVTDDTTTTTLVTGALTTSHLWASDRHIGPEVHSRIGQQMQQRVANNPF
jgi:outer membrane lipase/esterase